MALLTCAWLAQEGPKEDPHHLLPSSPFHLPSSFTPPIMKLVLGLVVLALVLTAALAELSNTKVLRTVDLTTQFARHNLTVTAENKGAAATSTYQLAVQNATHLAYIRVESEAGAPLDVKLKESKSEYV